MGKLERVSVPNDWVLRVRTWFNRKNTDHQLQNLASFVQASTCFEDVKSGTVMAQ